MTNREWIQGILKGQKGLPTPQYWMSFFNADTARKLSSPECHFDGMSLYDAQGDFNMTGISERDLDKLMKFNEQTDRCFSCLGRGAAVMFGHGGPGEFFCRQIQKTIDHMIVEYETGVKVKVNFKPHFYHSFDHPVKNLDDLKNLKLPDPNDPNRYSGIAQNAKYLKDKGQYVFASLNGFFSGLHYWLIDYQETLMAMISEPQFIEAAVEKLGHWNLAAAKNLIEAGVDGLAICDDLGSKQNLLMSPVQYRQFFKPWHKKLCDLAHNMSATVHLHSHGAIHELLDDLVDCGFDFVNPFDPDEGFDIETILRDYSEKFVVVGGFPGTFWHWPTDQKKVYINKMAGLGRKYPRFIFMDSSGIPDDISPQEYKEITEMSQKARGTA